MSEPTTTAPSTANPPTDPPAPRKSTFVDKTPSLLPFLLPLLTTHLSTHTNPFLLGLSGIQGSGKTTLTNNLAKRLRTIPHPTASRTLSVATLSLDDFYLSHSSQLALAAANPDNPLIQVRGQPGTHDVELLVSTLQALKRGEGEVKVPKYDKSLFDGAGDRLGEEEWEVVRAPVDVVLVEGWCVGFRAFEEDSDVVMRWAEGQMMGGVLGRQRLVDLRWINERLKGYGVVTDQLDALIHIDAEELEYVYEWRLQQEHKLILRTGMGMSDEKLRKFIDCYMPAYEMYLDGLREGAFPGETGKGKHQLRVVLGRDRLIKTMEVYQQDDQ